MYVETILRNKGANVITVLATATVTQAARIFREHGIGAVVVVDEQESLVGIFSERDIVRGIDMQGAATMTLPLANLLTREVITITASMSIDEAMQLMTENRVRHLPVMDGDRLAGIISIGDLVKRKIETSEHEAAELREYITNG